MYKPQGGNAPSEKAESSERSLLNVGRMNSLSDSTISMTGSGLSGSRVGTIYLSGANPRTAGPLEENILYKIVSPVKMNVLATTGSLVSASVVSEYVPADTPVYHFAKSGSSQYISARRYDGTDVEFWLSIVERPE